ncbi:GMC family oxidoreductase [Paenibacillus ehimensis]|uniref:GMC family oxidoreductase n=1 Tax=Paenibacillus ehimensis TaxID=79264 RepID=A0ABT8V9R9_9BACL|nr:GMC family oxidoreductase [Paenibacillus ehimensis]MDO3677271.1 GMC family oxidoreductase [Paenibacillus ehimensis]MEC0208947.1 GMC family oxidoreductase [Paenibacillus ehimensis]
MKRKYEGETVDVVIVGAGAAGGVLAKELSEAGMSVVVLEAGPFRDPQHDFASDELAMQSLGWQEARIVDGRDPLQMGHNNSGWGVGGGTTHFTGVFLRFHESDFRTKTLDGVGEDWPITYSDLEPYYTKIEKEIAVSGPKYFPWGEFHGPYPYPERDPISPNAQVFARGCEKLGIRWVVSPLAILSAPFEGRPPCINRGFCNQGCMPDAKFSTLIVHIPKAMKAGAEVLADCRVTQVNTDESGRATGVTFVHNDVTYEQRARLVIVSAYVVETPRLLLNSANSRFPDGLANSSGWVGKAFMTHSSHDVYARFEEEVRLYKGTPVLATTQDFYSTSPERDFARGYTLHAHGVRPVSFASGITQSDEDGPVWGKRLRETILDYNYFGRVTLVGEVLPNPDNAITLSDEKDAFGMPRAKVTFSYGENDRRLIQHAIGTMSEILSAAGGKPEFVVPDTAHLMGGCRMGNDPDTSVVNSYGQTHDIPNLFICDASIFVTSGGGNPTNTVMALAARTADYIKATMKRLDL